MRLLKWLLIAIVVLIVGAVAVGLVLPDQAHVERSIVIDAKPATVFTVLNGFKQFNKWSPWAALDPRTTYTVEGPLVGPGAKQSWRSEDPSVGAGSQEILEAVPFERIVVKLVFEGFDSDNLAVYTLRPEGEGTRITWSYDSTFKGDLLARYFGLMLDRMLGPDYERGLAELKTLVENLPRDDLSAIRAEVLRVQAQPIVYVSAAAPIDEAAGLLNAAYAKLSAHLAAHGLKQVAPPIAITRAFNEETRNWRFDAALMVDRDDPPGAPESGIQSGRSYAGDILRVTHVGPYATMETTYGALTAWRTVAGFEDNGDSWEEYVSDPGTTPAAERITRINWPIK
ncbi:SRPBCC family protein [Fontimonas sp. SYSU GA230001]|uniref:SRPBCC family protein n=1 Tax=Fontimonas sp. SYSU GA230001 TaxID=3142450 RepID=UPI0032B48483